MWCWMRSSPPPPLSCRPCACLLSTWPATAGGEAGVGLGHRGWAWVGRDVWTASLLCPVTSLSLGSPHPHTGAVRGPASGRSLRGRGTEVGTGAQVPRGCGSLTAQSASPGRVAGTLPPTFRCCSPVLREALAASPPVIYLCRRVGGGTPSPHSAACPSRAADQ